MCLYRCAQFNRRINHWNADRSWQWGCGGSRIAISTIVLSQENVQSTIECLNSSSYKRTLEPSTRAWHIQSRLRSLLTLLFWNPNIESNTPVQSALLSLVDILNYVYNRGRDGELLRIRYSTLLRRYLIYFSLLLLFLSKDASDENSASKTLS